MFNQNNEEEKKLDWMYKGATSTVSREEYLLGRPVDKTLEQINEEEKQKQQNLLTISKSKVEHECIPPSIRDFNKMVQSEQVDLSAKLQEDPLVTIKKREEETRRQFLQNPVQLKKLQKALKAQQAKKKKKKKKKSKGSDSDSDLDKKLAAKLLGRSKISKEEKNLDIILIHKYEALKDKLSDSDLQDILNGKLTDSDESSDERKKTKKRRESSDSSSSESYHKHRKYDSDSDSARPKKLNYGLVSSDGKKIPLKKSQKRDYKPKVTKAKTPPPVQERRAKKMTDKEKEKLRREMMTNAIERDREREKNVRKYRREEEKEKKERKDFDADFIHKQLLKSANSSSVESRIKSKMNNIQRSGRDMDRNFSKR